MADDTSVEIVRLATIARGRDGTEELRISVDEYRPARGEPARYVTIRIWFRDSAGDWHPTKKGLTIRRRELAEVLRALGRADQSMSGGQPTRADGWHGIS